MKISRGIAILAALLAAGCSNLYWHGEAFRHYYPSSSKETDQQLEERLAIMHWTNPKDKKRIGYLEQYKIQLEGSRDLHDIYYLRDASGQNTLGYISENGIFYRYTSSGQAVRVGEYPIRQVGVRVFFGYPKGDNIAFEDIPLTAD